MKILVLSYSLTGNNNALATSIAAALQAEHISVSESNTRSTGKIVLDILLNRTPKVNPTVSRLDTYDLVILIGPVWMGQVATPLRAYLKHISQLPGQYAFVSISGGSDGPNPKLEDELNKRTGKAPIALIDLHIADLLPPEPKPTREMTSAYHINESDATRLREKVVNIMKKKILQKTN